MVKMFLAFVIIFLIFFYGIDFFRKMNGGEKWELVKLVSYSVACTIATVVFLVSFVVLF
jgi:hypothetical protein